MHERQHQSEVYCLWSVRFPLPINLFITLELSVYALLGRFFPSSSSSSPSLSHFIISPLFFFHSYLWSNCQAYNHGIFLLQLYIVKVFMRIVYPVSFWFVSDHVFFSWLCLQAFKPVVGKSLLSPVTAVEFLLDRQLDFLSDHSACQPYQVIFKFPLPNTYKHPYMAGMQAGTHSPSLHSSWHMNTRRPSQH